VTAWTAVTSFLLSCEREREREREQLRDFAMSDQLQANLLKEQSRLELQLAELEECKEDLDEEEYSDMLKDTTKALESLRLKLGEGVGDVRTEREKEEEARRQETGKTSSAKDAISAYTETNVSVLRRDLAALVGAGLTSANEEEARGLVTAIRKAGVDLTEEEDAILNQHENLFHTGTGSEVDVAKFERRLSKEGP
jgi:hypothetical protein